MVESNEKTFKQFVGDMNNLAESPKIGSVDGYNEPKTVGDTKMRVDHSEIEVKDHPVSSKAQHKASTIKAPRLADKNAGEHEDRSTVLAVDEEDLDALTDGDLDILSDEDSDEYVEEDDTDE